jgi:hypothetical protein
MCDNTRPESDLPDIDPDRQVECRSHEDCADRGPNARCVEGRGDFWCTWDACFSDDDCDSGSACQCEGGFWSDHNVCLDQGNCRTNDDCGANYCSPSLGDCGHYTGPVGYFCHGDADTCVDDEDCEDNGYCAFNPALENWACSNAECAG